MDDVDPEVPEVPLEPHVERIAEDIAGILVVGFGGRGMAVLDEEPTNVAPKCADPRRMRVGLMVGMLMMQPMNDDPPGWGLLQIAHAQQGERVFEPKRTLKAAMR